MEEEDEQDEQEEEEELEQIGPLPTPIEPQHNESHTSGSIIGGKPYYEDDKEIDLVISQMMEKDLHEREYRKFESQRFEKIGRQEKVTESASGIKAGWVSKMKVKARLMLKWLLR